MQPRDLHFQQASRGPPMWALARPQGGQGRLAWLLAPHSGASRPRCALQPLPPGPTPLVTSLGVSLPPSPHVASKPSVRVWPGRKWRCWVRGEWGGGGEEGATGRQLGGEVGAGDEAGW